MVIWDVIYGIAGFYAAYRWIWPQSVVICGPIINVDGFSRGDSTSKAVGVSNFDGIFLVGCMINHKEDGSIECAARCKNQTLFFEDSFFSRSTL